ncbi:MAG: hypothetical protein JSU63_09390, partial [Phycisphaerales bacterium]
CDGFELQGKAGWRVGNGQAPPMAVNPHPHVGFKNREKFVEERWGYALNAHEIDRYLCPA